MSARIHALTIDTHAVDWAFTVALAARQQAGDLRITHQARRALAYRPVLYAVTDGLGTARATVRRARLNAGAIAAHILTWAVGLAATTSFNTIYIRVSLVSGNADANRFVVPNVALGVRAAVARIDADSIDAGAVTGTLAVRGARHVCDSRYGLTSSASVTYVATWADADHRSHWQRTDHLTGGGLVARLQNVARVLAPLVEAGELRRAVTVFSAFGPLLFLTE